MSTHMKKITAKTGAKKRLLGSLVALTLFSQTATYAEDFSVIVLPDTQNYSESFPEIYDAQTEWIAEQEQNLNVRFVTHLGDLVEKAKNIDQWENAFFSMSNLDNANIPYGVIAGNHDFLYPGDYYDPTGTNYLTYFGPQRYADEEWYRGASPSGLSNYQIINVGGEDFLFLHLTMETPAAELAWAQTVLNDHQDIPTWVSTHRYLYDWWILGAGRYNNFNYTFEPLYRHDGVKSNDFFKNFVAANKQIYLVHCGHNHSEYRQTSQNNFGNTVHEVLADYQSDPNGGNGWLRICKIKPEQNKIEVQTYSPTLQQFETDADSKFTLSVNFDDYKAEPNKIVVQLQNGLEGYDGTQDTWLNEDKGNNAYGNSDVLVADDDVNNAWFSENPGQTLMKFTDFTQGPVYEGDPNPTRIPNNATVVSAQLTLNLENDQDMGNATYRVYPVAKEWNESSTWNSFGDGIDVGNQTGAQITAFKGDNNPSLDSSRTLDITSAAQAWLDGSLENQGLAIIRDMTSGNDDGIEIYSSEASNTALRPKMSVEITYPVLNRAPEVTTLVSASALTVNEGEEVAITLAAQDPNNKDPLVFMLEGQDVGYATGAGQAEHYMLMEDEGFYTFNASVRDDETTVEAGSVSITVNNLPPQIISLTEDQSIASGTDLQFAVEASDPGAYDTISIAWDTDGDGVYDDQQGTQGSMIFANSGNYTIGVKVTDNDGASSYDSFTITVQ